MQSLVLLKHFLSANFISEYLPCVQINNLILIMTKRGNSTIIKSSA